MILICCLLLALSSIALLGTMLFYQKSHYERSQAKIELASAKALLVSAQKYNESAKEFYAKSKEENARADKAWNDLKTKLFELLEGESKMTEDG